MKLRKIVCTLAIPVTSAGLLAQENVVITGGRGPGEGVVLAQGAIGMVGLSGEPTNIKFTQEFSFINGRTVMNAPYSADEKTESVQTLSDGTTITNTTSARVYRDSEGRTRREMTLPGPGGDAPHVLITVSDPVAGTNYTLDQERKVAHQMPGMAVTTKMRQEMDAKLKAEAEARSSMTLVRSASTTTSKREDLGSSVIEGISATGTRETSVIEAGAMGNDRPITISSERWMSPDLQIEIKSVHNDPRMGQTIHTVTNINRGEPDASLFQVPADYRLEEGKEGPQIQRYQFRDK